MKPEKAAAIQFNTWPRWQTIEPAGTRIRILWILHDYVPFVNAGSEICAHTINKFLMRKPYKYDIWVASPGYPNRTYENIRCFDLHDTSTLFEVLKSSNMLSSHSYIYRKQIMWLSRKTGKPFLEWVHTDNYVKAIKQWNDPQVEGRHFTIFNSKSLRSLRRDIDERYIRIIRPAVDYRKYIVERKTETAKYVTLSNVNDNKGGKLLIRLAKALPEIEFQGIIGGYREQIVDKSLPNLKYIQHTTQIKDVYANTWVLIMPSKEETWGRTAVEAMSSGIPVLVNPTPGLKECCENAALYCDRNNLTSWVEMLRRLKHDQEFYNSRSVLSYQHARLMEPTHELNQMEDWIAKEVLGASTYVDFNPAFLEKNLLFR
jgi:glycosyltransferase involved in cell wall biosynthesis